MLIFNSCKKKNNLLSKILHDVPCDSKQIELCKQHENNLKQVVQRSTMNSSLNNDLLLNILCFKQTLKTESYTTKSEK